MAWEATRRHCHRLSDSCRDGAAEPPRHDPADSGVSQETPVTRATQVHLTYFTVWPADDGRLITYDDMYGRDERMARAFSTVAVASR